MHVVTSGTNDQPSPVACLGTANLGAYASEEEGRRILDCSVDHGIRCIDTANNYGQTHREWGTLDNPGRTETLLGRWLAKSARRTTLTIATKFGTPVYADPVEASFSPRQVIRACHDSLRRLCIDRIDVYQLHEMCSPQLVEPLFDALMGLRQAGKIASIGVCNHSPDALERVTRAAAERSLPLVWHQFEYNFLRAQLSEEILTASLRRGLACLGWSPLAGGALAGPGERRGRRELARADCTPTEHAILRRFEALVAAGRRSPAEVALAWLGRRLAGRALPILGPRTEQQLLLALRALRGLALDPETYEALIALAHPPSAVQEIA